MNAKLFLMRQYSPSNFELIVQFDDIVEGDDSSCNRLAEVQINLEEGELSLDMPFSEIEKMAIKKAKEFLSKI